LAPPSPGAFFPLLCLELGWVAPCFLRPEIEGIGPARFLFSPPRNKVQLFPFRVLPKQNFGPPPGGPGWFIFDFYFLSPTEVKLFMGGTIAFWGQSCGTLPPLNDFLRTPLKGCSLFCFFFVVFSDYHKTSPLWGTSGDFSFFSPPPIFIPKSLEQQSFLPRPFSVLNTPPRKRFPLNLRGGNLVCSPN